MLQHQEEVVFGSIDKDLRQSTPTQNHRLTGVVDVVTDRLT